MGERKRANMSGRGRGREADSLLRAWSPARGLILGDLDPRRSRPEPQDVSLKPRVKTLN